MKHQQRFCCECDKETNIVIKEHTTYAMYYCRECGAEICRVGEKGEPNHNRKTILNGIDKTAFLSDSGHMGLSVARRNPNVLSDENRLWQPRDEEAEFRKQQKINAFKTVFEKLTSRQKQIIKAVEICGTHKLAAKELNVTRTLVTNTMKIVQKKLEKHMSKHLKALVGEDN